VKDHRAVHPWGFIKSCRHGRFDRRECD
jgi:hypothetical protein